MTSKVSSSLALLALLAAGVSGCLGKESSSPTPTQTAAAARLEGAVLEEGGLPIAGATVRILLMERQATTGADGRYGLADLPAGPARVLASAAGHAAATRDIVLQAGVVHLIDFVLRELPAREPYNRTLSFQGKITCSAVQGVSCTQATGPGATQHRFAVDGGLAAVLVEMTWNPTLPGSAARLHVDARAATATACGTRYAQAEGAAPLRLALAEGFPTRGGHQCVLVRAPADQAAVDQAYELFVTLFYHSGIPPGFSALPNL